MKSNHLTLLTLILIYLTGALQPSRAAGTLPLGAVGYWPGDGNALDYAGTNNGTLENGSTYAPGRMGLGFAFTNHQDVSIAWSPSLVLISCTVQAWINPTGATNGLNDPWMLIFGQRNGPYSLQMNPGTNGGWVVSLQEYNGYSQWYGVAMVGEVPTNRFTHILATWDGTTAKIYTNGVLNTEGPLPTLGWHYTDLFFIGGDYAVRGIGDGFFSGVIDEVALWNRVLTQDEITYLASWHMPQVGLAKAVKPVFSDLVPDMNYQLQVSGDMNNWTNYGSVFTATSSVMDYPQYWDVDDWGSLFFRLQVSP